MTRPVPQASATAPQVSATACIRSRSPWLHQDPAESFNGTAGVVTGLPVEEHRLAVLTEEDESVDYGLDELDELAHAYAVTIHRSRAASTRRWSCLICDDGVLDDAAAQPAVHGVTRAKKLVVLAGSRRALAAALRTRAQLPPHGAHPPPAAR